MVYLRLRQAFDQVYYWQETHQGEVDFIAVDGKQIIPYQVTWEYPDPRHERALNYFYQQFPQAAEAVFVTKENAKDYL